MFYCFHLQFGMFIIRNLSDYFPQMFEPHIPTFINYFSTTLSSAEDCTSSIVYDAICSMNNLLESSLQVPQVCKFIQNFKIIFQRIMYFRSCKHIHNQCLVC